MRRNLSQRWLVPYADIMTLLFACFATLYAMSNLPDEVREQHVEQLSTLFLEQPPVTEHVDQKRVSQKVVASVRGLDLVTHLESLTLSAQGKARITAWAEAVSGSDTKLALVCHVGMGHGGVMSAAKFCGLVGEQLLRRGVSSRRLQIINKGEGDPVASNLSPQEALKNFRVELIELRDDRQQIP